MKFINFTVFINIAFLKYFFFYFPLPRSKCKHVRCYLAVSVEHSRWEFSTAVGIRDKSLVRPLLWLPVFLLPVYEPAVHTSGVDPNVKFHYHQPSPAVARE